MTTAKRSGHQESVHAPGRNAALERRRRNSAVDLGSGQRDLEAPVKRERVMGEGSHRALESRGETEEKPGELEAVLPDPWRRILRSRLKPRQVGADLRSLTQEAIAERLRDAVRRSLSAHRAQSIEKCSAQEERFKEEGQDRGTMLAPRQTEVREQRDRLPCSRAQETHDSDLVRRRRIGKERPPLVPAVPSQAMMIVAEQALEGLRRDEAVRLCLISVDSTGNRAYSLHQYLAVLEAAGCRQTNGLLH